jgi:hypothetical protein
VKPLGELSYLYILIAAGLLLYYTVDYFFSDKVYIRDEIAFLLVFVLVALPFTPLLNVGEFFWIDTDQLNEFYAILISILAGVLFAVPLELLNKIKRIPKSAIYKLSWGLLIISIPALIYWQGGIRVSRALPSTVPNGFFESYYQIVDERLPYTYATVGPEVQRIQAKNRHFYMDYDYFLDEYAAIDSVYNEQIGQETIEEVPPASIFIFTVKPPYSGIQQGILYNPSGVMRDVEQWMADFRSLPNRQVRVFYEDVSTKVYEIVNREEESKVSDILYHIYPNKRQNLLSPNNE